MNEERKIGKRISEQILNITDHRVDILLVDSIKNESRIIWRNCDSKLNETLVYMQKTLFDLIENGIKKEIMIVSTSESVFSDSRSIFNVLLFMFPKNSPFPEGSLLIVSGDIYSGILNTEVKNILRSVCSEKDED